MSIFNKKEPIILLLGDLFFFLLSLWFALALRSLELPSKTLFLTHLRPFSFLFLIWVIVFYIAGLYEKHTVLLRSRLPVIIANTQVANSVIAVLFFYFIPFFGITPKTVLFIYLFISFVLILSWRMYGYFLVGILKKENAVILSSGIETEELRNEINRNNIYNIRITEKHEDASVIVMDLSDERVVPLMPDFYELLLAGVKFVDMHKLYEDIFERVPLSLLKHAWFIQNISTDPKTGYDSLKRLMDIFISLPFAVVSLIVYPFVYIAIKADDGGPLFIAQERVGKNNKLIRILKFRTMSGNDNGQYNAHGSTDLKVTKVGAFLRESRIDELPQLFSVLKGDLSLVGPRPELPSLVKHYEQEIPYYNIRNIIKPGLSGWAQIYQENHPHHGEAVGQTKEKLAYDLYYIKNRSLLLDLKIALRTVKTLLSRVGK